MTNVALIQFILGVVVMAVGLGIGWRSGGRVIVLVGSISFVLGAANLIGNARSDFQLPALIVAGVYIVALMATASRASWRATRVEVVLGLATVTGILALYFLYPESSSASSAQNFLLLLVRVLGWSFVIVMVVRILLKMRVAASNGNA